MKNHNISISVWLGAFPEECIEYVVVHELVHLLEKGHNARFYGYLDQHYPAWKMCEGEVKEYIEKILMYCIIEGESTQDNM